MSEDMDKGSAVMQVMNRPNQRQVGVKPVPGKEPTKFNPVKKGDEMEEVEKDMKGPESPGVKRPGKIPLSANRSAITEEPATRSSTSQNYKNTPDMNKGDKDWDDASRNAQRHETQLKQMDRKEQSKKEPITKSDEAALKKSLSDATTLIKAMTISVERM